MAASEDDRGEPDALVPEIEQGQNARRSYFDGPARQRASDGLPGWGAYFEARELLG